MKLYEISDAFKSFMDAVEAGEIPEEAIPDTLAGIEGEFEDKADAIACLIKSTDAEAEAIKAEVRTLSDRARSKNAAADRMRDYLLTSMQAIDKKKIETPRNVISVAKKPDSVVITNEADLFKLHPDLFSTPAPVPSKVDIKERLKNGEQLTGCELRGGFRLAVK